MIGDAMNTGYDETTVETTEGYIYPHTGDMKPLCWDFAAYHTATEERAGFPKMRAVIRAMIVHRPEQIRREYRELVKASFNKTFGYNARTQFNVLVDELLAAGITELPNAFGPIQVKHISSN